MASLLSIPLEVLLLITPQLSTKDLGSLRLTCKTLEQALFDDFVREFFVKRQFMLTEKSLQTLIDISKHPNLSKKLTHVILSTDEYSDPRLHHFTSEASCRKYIGGMHEQLTLYNTGIDREMLTEAFRGLSNLKIVGIRDYSATGRLRDGPRARWTSYGATAVFHETGVRLQTSANYGNDKNTKARLFSLAIYALGKSGRTPPTIEVIFRSLDGLGDHAFNVPSFTLSTVRPVLQGLRSLFLTVSAEDGVGSAGTWFGGVPAPHPLFPGPSMGEFLAHTSNLVHLRLNFKQSSSPSNPFLLWLAKPVASPTHGNGSDADVSMTPAPIALPHLKRLDLGMLVAHPDDVLAVVEKFASTLRHFALWKIKLQDKTKRSPPDPRACNYWSGLFSALVELPTLHLETFEVGQATQFPADPLHQLVWFKTKGLDAGTGEEEDEDEDEEEREKDIRNKLLGCENQFKLQGSNTMVMLAKLARKVVVPWEPRRGPEYDDDDDGDDDDDDEDMDDEDVNGEDEDDDDMEEDE